MRPRNLKLEGFTCFRDEVEIDFTGMDVFVIAGPTGAGKTTIIDAICYALYGKIPRGTTVKDLIAHDASAMRVQLEFDSAGRVFRVHRGVNVTRTTSKKTGAEKVSRDISPVQFEELIGSDWTPLEDRVERIEAKIEEVVGLDFDSFTKCVLLPQGRFAEFLTGKPDERRKILVELLDIGIYARIMQAANNRAATLNTQIVERERQLDEDYANATQEALAATREQLAQAGPLLETERARRVALQDATEHASAVSTSRRHEQESKTQLETRTSELASAEATAKDGAATLAALTQALEEAERELARSSYDAALYAALVRAEQCARQADHAREAMAAAHAVATDRGTLDAATLAASDADAKHAAARKAAVAVDAALRAAQVADAAAHLRSGLEPGDPCPVCGGVIGELPTAKKSGLSEAERALEAARAEESAAGSALTRSTTALARAEEASESAQKQAAAAEEALARAEQELRAVVPEGVAAETAAITARFAEQERACAAHEMLTTNVERGRRALYEHRQLFAESERTIAALMAEIAQLEAMIDAGRREGDAALDLLKQIAATWKWDEVSALIAQKKSPADLLKEMLDASQSDTEALARRIATLEAAEKTIESAIARAAELRAELLEMKDRYQLCRELGILLRADNFQQFVILEAMHVLADAASAHLGRLFDRYSIRVDGGEFAVVDHWQADQVRPAKTLSGGETFVASLALALALAESLPELRRAAASSLESLFLDEGFGTLDADTLDTVIEALENLRSQERMVGVITHVPELTQRIEHRIIVRKSQSGSSIEVAGVLA